MEKEGWMNKQSGNSLVKKWQERWFTYENYELSYYKKKEDKHPRGTIHLNGCDVRRSPDNEKPWCFEVEIPSRIYYFQAPNETQLEEWLEILIKAKEEAPPVESTSTSMDAPLNAQEEADLIERFKEGVKIRTTIADLLRILKREPASSKRDSLFEPGTNFTKAGVMWKFHQSRGVWNSYKFVLKGSTLFRYATAETSCTEIKTIMRMNWVRTEDLAGEEDSLLVKQLESKSQASSKRLIIYASKKTYKISPSTDFEVEDWYTALRDGLAADFVAPGELKEKEDADAELTPYLKKQYKLEEEHTRNALDILDQAGIGTREVNHIKMGRLKVRKDLKHDWIAYTVVLQPNAIYFHEREGLEKSSEPAVSIPLTYTNIQVELEDVEVEIRERVFKIVTPIRSFYFKAKHRFAMDSWVFAVEKCMYGREKGWFSDKVKDLPYHSVPGSSKYENKLSTTEDMTGKHMEFVVVKSEVVKVGNTFELKPGSNPLGRAVEGQGVKIMDPKISRDQCVIEVNTERNEVVLIDSGSRRGTKVNNNPVEKLVLMVGDEVKVGDTLLKLQVVKTKRGLFG